MSRFEYKVVTAPRTGRRIKGVRGVEARFAMTVEEVINDSASDGWEYVRTETLPCEHRGWLRRRVEDHTVLIFRRSREVEPRHVFPSAAEHEPPTPRLSAAAERAAGRRVKVPNLRPAGAASPHDPARD